MPVTKEQALTANLFHNEYGDRWRRNGKTKVWVTRPNKFRIPVKFGMYSYGYITDLNASEYHVAQSYDKSECVPCADNENLRCGIPIPKD